MAYVIFKIGATDYTPKLIRQDYDVEVRDVTETWVDANYLTHNEVVRTRVSGTVRLLFQSPAEYNAFQTDLAAVRAADGTYTLDVRATNKESTASLEHITATLTQAVAPTYGTPMYEYYPAAFTAVLTITEV